MVFEFQDAILRYSDLVLGQVGYQIAFQFLFKNPKNVNNTV